MCSRNKPKRQRVSVGGSFVLFIFGRGWVTFVFVFGAFFIWLLPFFVKINTDSSMSKSIAFSGAWPPAMFREHVGSASRVCVCGILDLELCIGAEYYYY